MPQPTPSDAHVDALLTQLSIGWVQDAASFVADQVFPAVNVQKQSDVYFTYAQEDFYRDQMQERAPGTESAGSGFDLTTESYLCKVWALHKDIDDQLRANADSPFAPDADTTKFLTEMMMIRKERDWVSKFFKTGVWGTDHTPSTLWDAADSDPLNDIETGIETVLEATGRKPNTGTIGYGAWRILKHHEEVVDRYKHTSAQSITTDMVARLVGLNRIVVAQAVHNNAVENATADYDFIAPNSMLLSYAPAAPSLMVPSAGYCFKWTGLHSYGTQATVSKFRMPKLRSDRLEIEAAWDYKVVAASCGYFLNGLTS